MAKYPKGRAPNSIWLACAPFRELLRRAYEERGLLYDIALERSVESGVCHIWYEPTLPGFRADPDDLPAKELFIDPSVFPFITARSSLLGDSYDLARTMLPKLTEPLKVTLGIQMGLPPELYRASLARFGNSTPHAYSIRPKSWQSANPWTQDFLKSGSVNGKPRILLTHMAYDGKRDPESRFRPLSEQQSDPRFVRSKISWEGGDLQFLRHPSDSRKLIIFYGNAAAPYWAGEISREEYEYILKLEFGADVAVNLSEVTDHIDYLMMPVPAARALLFGEPIRENLQLARSALKLLEHYYLRENAPGLVEIGSLLREDGNPLAAKTKELKAAIQRARSRLGHWYVNVDSKLIETLQSYIDRECQGKKERCLEPEKVASLLRQGDDFIRQWGEAAVLLDDYQSVGKLMLAIIESQLSGFESARHRRIQALAETLEAMGFRLVRVPLVAFDPSLKTGIPGLSYANSIVIGKRIFMPSIGFEDFERNIRNSVRTALPDYEIVPVFARHAILHGGGIHCMVGIVRDSEPKLSR